MMSSEQLIAELSACLHRDVDAFGTMPDTPTGKRTAQRLRAVAEHAPPFLYVLVEPLVDTGCSMATMTTLIECARVHLYARVLDDVLDENLPLDRRNLLKAQPLFWRAVYTLGTLHPAQSHTSSALIEATVRAVDIDDAQPSPDEWGRKNFHLLLAPLLISGDSASYRAALPGLSALIAVVQACEEYQQGRLRQPSARDALTSCLVSWLDVELITTLQQGGWRHAAVRLVRDGGALLSRMTRHSTSA